MGHVRDYSSRPSRWFALLGSACVLLGLAVRPVDAQVPAPTPLAAPALEVSGVVSRTDSSGVVVTATRITKPITVDGRLDDDVYQSVPAISGFIQQEPREGEPATEPTDVWLMFDDKNLYVSARCWDSQPEREVANELRRDLVSIFNNENFTVTLDTFHDLRNGFFFQTNPLGAVRDQAIVDEQTNANWNTIWDVRTHRFDKGYSIEMAIPFKSLRYRAAGSQVWGINFRRVVRWKNEFSYLTPMLAAFGTGNAVARMGSAATLVGIETPRRSMNLEFKPFATTSLTTDRTGAAPFNNDPSASAGFDFKYGVTRGLVADATVNTDFAQVEEDQQQVNLTRFNLFFPEKRDFFMEGQGVFSFGGTSFSGSNTSSSSSEVPVMFFSRRIGLSNGQAVPVIAGGRLTGRTGRYTLGLLNMQTGEKHGANAVSTNFSVVRIKRDILRRSNIGMIATRRDVAIPGDAAGLTVGADANFLLLKNVTATAYVAKTDTAGRSSGQTSYRGRVEYGGDRYGMVAEHLLVGELFDPEVGYVRRTDFRRTYDEVRFSAASEEGRSRAKVLVRGQPRLHHRRQGVARPAEGGSRQVQYRLPEAGTAGSSSTSSSTSCCRAPFTINPGDDRARGRLQLSDPADPVHARQPAQCVRHGQSRIREPLQRQEDRSDLQRADWHRAAIRPRAEHLAQLGASPLGQLLLARCRLAHHLHDQSAGGGEQLHSVQRRSQSAQLLGSPSLGIPRWQ